MSSALVAGPIALAKGLWSMVEGQRDRDPMAALDGGLSATAGGLTTALAAGATSLASVAPGIGALAGGFWLGRRLDGALDLSGGLSDMSVEWDDKVANLIRPGSIPRDAGSVAEGRTRIAKQAGGVPDDAWGDS